MRRKRAIYIIALLVTLVILFHPGRHARYYNYVPLDQVFSQLETVEFPKVSNNPPPICPETFYKDMLLSTEKLDHDEIFTDHKFISPQDGGAFTPTDCSPIFKTAIVVPYRDRPQQLALFLAYMHSFLQRQLIAYRIYVADQTNTAPFNRAKMLNAGARAAIADGYPCLILHDVDLFPLSLANLYACSRSPRHLSTAVDTLRYNLPYPTIVGGVTAVTTRHFERVNGMSNEFFGWGGEDDDFYKRLVAAGLEPHRFPPHVGLYAMLFHKKQKPSETRWKGLLGEFSEKAQFEDGLRSIPGNVSVVARPLYTHVIVS